MPKIIRNSILLLLVSFNLCAEGVIPTTVRLKFEFGHISQKKNTQFVQFANSSPSMKISFPTGKELEKNDSISSESHITYGAGDTDVLLIDVEHTSTALSETRNLASHSEMWKYLLENGLPGQIKRLSEDTWNQVNAPIITVNLNKEGTRGFSIALDQLIKHKAMWLPQYDIFISLADDNINYYDFVRTLKDKRVLDCVQTKDDTSLYQYRLLWSDFGNPTLSDPSWDRWQTNWMGTKGHLIITAPAHGSIYKLAFDRWGNIRPDFASPHKFKMDIDWPKSQWKGQKIINGLPVIETVLEKNNQLFKIEQFVAPLRELDQTISGYIPGVAFSKINISGEPGDVEFNVGLNTENESNEIELRNFDKKNWFITEKKHGNILMVIESENGINLQADTLNKMLNNTEFQFILTIKGNIKKNKSTEVTFKLPSPILPFSQSSYIKDFDFQNAKNNIVQNWEKWLNKGAQFNVPEEEVNQLYRANLWHALILPRHTIGTDNKPHMDIPYANTAYGQQNADWPINQAVYVDYMIYGLRGYYEIANDEFLSMFKTQQLSDGRIGGFANWGVYTPGQLYAIAQNYLLSRNNKQFEELLPSAIKALDWCFSEIEKANKDSAESNGLILAPLNDLSKSEREWAFNQAYFYGGLELFGRALSVYGHSRAGEVLQMASKMKENIEKAFSKSSVKSPVVQLKDGTWSNYVPADALTSRRLLDEWYPTDVDTGPLHLTRLGAIDPSSWLTTAMLNDHEDNLFYKNQGAANEPVYLPQANAYFLRDEPKAVIRSFYSMMASAFSHNQLSPLEHRWGHPQYYGPPSTDGAWFEIYRRMLINEIGYDTLFIGQAIPREWLANNKKIEIKNAPSYFGPVSYRINGLDSNDEISITMELSNRNFPKELLIRFRHPKSKNIKSVMVNGELYKDFDIEKEIIRLSKPDSTKYSIIVKY